MEIRRKGLLKSQQALPQHKCAANVYTFHGHECDFEILLHSFL